MIPTYPDSTFKMKVTMMRSPLMSSWMFLMTIVMMMGSQQKHFSSAQLLPGVDEKVELETSLESMKECAQASQAINDDPEMNAELVEFFTVTMDTAFIDSCMTNGMGDILCDVDVANYEHRIKPACLNLNGTYDERQHSIACIDPQTEAFFIYTVQNFPSCHAALCEPPDVERFVARDVEFLEYLFVQDTGYVCDSQYTLEEEEKDSQNTHYQSVCGVAQEEKNETSSLTPVATTPEQCGPLESQTQGENCDCYSFCNGQLIACANKGDTVTLECPGTLVPQCTMELFGAYNAQQPNSAAAARSVTSVSSSLSSLLGTFAIAMVVSFL